MNDFRERLAQFRDALDAEAAQCAPPDVRMLLARDLRARRIRWRWAVGTVAILALGSIPAYRIQAQRQREAAQARADAVLMEQVSEGLARPVPRAMTALMGIGFGELP